MRDSTSRQLLLLHPDDSCLIAATPLARGQNLLIDGHMITLPQDIAAGHKVARAAHQQGEKVIRFGAAIGSATTDIQVGESIHLHNMKSDYIATYSHSNQFDGE